jgi:aspartyl-tRNA(Asn)/glutamyl-tRNA(Gln) amidotransferase subunit C
MEQKDVEKLASLARLEIPENEKQEFLDNLQSILGYVSQIQEVTGSATERTIGTLYNIVREDDAPHISGTYTEKILNEAPATEDGFLKVKQIL